MRKIFAVAAMLMMLAVFRVEAQGYLGAANQDYTNVNLTSTSSTNMTLLLAGAANAVIEAQVDIYNGTNSTQTAYIAYGTNTIVFGAGIPVAPGTHVFLNSPPRPQAAIYGYIQNTGSANLNITRQPASITP